MSFHLPRLLTDKTRAPTKLCAQGEKSHQWLEYKKNVLDPSAVFVLFDVAVLDKAWARGYTRIGGGQLGAVRDG